MSEMFALLERAQSGDDEACQQVLTENSGLIWSIVKRYYGCGVETDDLYQLGCIGFLKAVKGFDLNYGTQFSTYAVPKISGEIRRFLRDDGQIHVSRSIRQNAQRIQAFCSEYGDETPPVGVIAAGVGLSEEDVLLAMEASQRPRSLNEPLGEDGLTLADVLGHDETERTLERIELRRLIEALSPREREVIVRRYYRDETQAAIARDMGMTQVQVSRLESRILARMRQAAM